MKIKKILTFVFAAALMTSCGNEDGPGGDGGNGGGTEHTEYFGVNMSGAEFGNVYPGVDGTHYGYPTKKDLHRLVSMPFVRSIPRLCWSSAVMSIARPAVGKR